MSTNHMNAKNVSIDANTSVTLFPENQGRTFLYIRAGSEPVHLRFAFSPASSSNFFLVPEEILRIEGANCPKEAIYAYSVNATVICAMQDTPTI